MWPTFHWRDVASCLSAWCTSNINLHYAGDLSQRWWCYICQLICNDGDLWNHIEETSKEDLATWSLYYEGQQTICLVQSGCVGQEQIENKSRVNQPLTFIRKKMDVTGVWCTRGTFLSTLRRHVEGTVGILWCTGYMWTKAEHVQLMSTCWKSRFLTPGTGDV